MSGANCERDHGSRHLDLSFGLIIIILNWIPLRTQRRIVHWLESEESDETLLMSLEVITKRIREQMLIDFEEFYVASSEREFEKVLGWS